ncbi:MAG TPA: cytochrome c nitrite reductase small subunit [Gemmatimonadaceae bacterium]|nr:cytochrome c nitrite reductase small subunit [Gemmatimonadaceae bacterium]
MEPRSDAPRRSASPVPLPVRLALFVLFGGIVGLGLFTVTYAEATSYLSDDPASCRNCHVMNDVYDAWSRGPHHAVATCNDCHIPHAFPDKYVVKAQNGWNHSLAFTLQNFPEPIRITPANRAVTQANCVYCHAEFVSLVHQGEEGGPLCARCHETVGHDENAAGKP